MYMRKHLRTPSNTNNIEILTEYSFVNGKLSAKSKYIVICSVTEAMGESENYMKKHFVFIFFQILIAVLHKSVSWL